MALSAAGPIPPDAVNPLYPRGCPIPSPALDPVEYSLHFARYIEGTEGVCVRKKPRDVFP